jgi:DNA phosphorothioation-associated putative methyltransferase
MRPSHSPEKDSSPPSIDTPSAAAQRWRTAISRPGFSRPIRIALNSGLISAESSVFDYGCGKGEDILRLRKLGVNAYGWDPAFTPNAALREADIVNISYVLNVIEAPLERAQALLGAWQLAGKALVVAARTTLERLDSVSRLGDGVVTGRGTFQRLYGQDELRALINTITETEPIAVAPGIFFVFRDSDLQQAFLAARLLGLEPSHYDLSLSIEDKYGDYLPDLEALASFFEQRGRLPRKDELLCAERLGQVFGSLRRAFSLVLHSRGVSWAQRSTQRKKEDLLVYFALLKFARRPRAGELPGEIQRDITTQFGSYRKALEAADQLLFSVGNRETLQSAFDSSAVGKRTLKALYVHESALRHLPPVLRVYEGCARVVCGDIEGANVIKLSSELPKVSYLLYPEFDKDPHPALVGSLIVSITDFALSYRDYSKSEDPPIMHRKELFVSSDYPLRGKFERLSKQEEKHGLYENAATIGFRSNWKNLLQSKGLTVRGHTLRAKLTH